MGYRSDGAIYLSEEALDLLPKELKDDLAESWEQDKEDENVFSFDSWKWYSSYPIIQLWEAFMDMMDDEGINYDFIRIGEDSDDNEVRTGEHFSLVRTWEQY